VDVWQRSLSRYYHALVDARSLSSNKLSIRFLIVRELQTVAVEHGGTLGEGWLPAGGWIRIAT